VKREALLKIRIFHFFSSRYFPTRNGTTKQANDKIIAIQAGAPYDLEMPTPKYMANAIGTAQENTNNQPAMVIFDRLIFDQSGCSISGSGEER
jgi:hypothetical protein